jgi:transcriptional regulator with XRE-family HTH domain
LSQEAFAEVLGVHRTYLGGIERGEHNLTLKSVERLAEKIGIEPTAMLHADVDAGVPNGKQRTRQAQLGG